MRHFSRMGGTAAFFRRFLPLPIPPSPEAGCFRSGPASLLSPRGSG